MLPASKDGILPQYYTMSQPRKTRIFTVVKTSNFVSDCVLWERDNFNLTE